MRWAISRTVLASEPPPRVSARGCGALLGQRRVADLPCGPSCVHDARCVGPTSAFSRFFVPVPAPRRLPTRHALNAPARSGTSPASRQCDSLRWAAPLSWCHRGGRCLPIAMRAVRTSGLPVASPTRRLSLARPAHPWKPPRPPSTRSRERCELYE